MENCLLRNCIWPVSWFPHFIMDPFPIPKQIASAPPEGSWTFLSVALWGCYTSASPVDNGKPPGWCHRRSRRKDRCLRFLYKWRSRVVTGFQHTQCSSRERYIRTKNSTACSTQHSIHKNFLSAPIFTRQWRSVKLCRHPPSGPKHIKKSQQYSMHSCSPRTAECGSSPDASFCWAEVYVECNTSAIIALI